MIVKSSNKKVSPFEIWKSISNSIKNEVESGDIPKDTVFNTYMICQIASAFPDSVHFANELNKLKNIPGAMPYHFLHTLIQPKRPRYSKWIKPKSTKDEDKLVSEYKEKYKCGTETAKSMIEIEKAEALGR